MESTDPPPHSGVNVQVDHRAEIALRRYGELESAMRGIAGNFAVPQGDQLTDFFVYEAVGFIARGVRREPERFAIEGGEDAFWRDVIPVLAIAGNKLAAAQVTERKVLDAPEIALAQQ